MLFCILQSVCSLLIGLLTYAVFRSGTIFHSLLLNFGIHLSGFSDLHFPLDSIVRYYLPDYLWIYSLSFAVLSVLLPKRLTAELIILFLIFLFGAAFEMLQALCVVPGTGDLLDVMAYFLATVSAAFVYCAKIKRKEEIQ